MPTEKKNTTPEVYDENIVENEENMSDEDILMSESDILAGLLDLDQTKDKKENYRKIQIKRDGVLKIEFRVRPLSEDESNTCWEHATTYASTKPGQRRIAVKTNQPLYRSFLIYSATVDEDREKLWDNQKALQSLNLIRGVEMIDRVLLSGEKDKVIEVIDELSGYNEETENIAKN